MVHMTNGFQATPEEEARHKTDFLLSIAYVSFQELATRVSHRNTGKVQRPRRRPVARQVAADENLHMIFYREHAVRPSTWYPIRLSKQLPPLSRTFGCPVRACRTSAATG